MLNQRFVERSQQRLGVRGGLSAQAKPAYKFFLQDDVAFAFRHVTVRHVEVGLRVDHGAT